MTRAGLSLRMDPVAFADGLRAQAAEFAELRVAELGNHAIKLRNAVRLVVVEAPEPIFAPLRWLMARLAGARWQDSRGSEWIKPLKRFDALIEAAGLETVALGDAGFEPLRAAYAEACRAAGNGPSKGGVSAPGDNRVFYRFREAEDWRAPGELDARGTWPEGSVARRLVNRYERSAEARRACLAIHGVRCAVCGIDFGEAYGEMGRGFIEVHHKPPLSGLPDGYRVDPASDLVPLCPNCHAMVHRMDDPADVEALSALWRSQNSGPS